MGMEKMNRIDKKPTPEEKKKHQRKALRFALAAIGALGSAPAQDAQAGDHTASRDPTTAEFQDFIRKQYGFIYKAPAQPIHPKETPREGPPSADEVSKMEAHIQSAEQIDLSLQIKFLQRAFRPDGPYMKAFRDPHLDPNTFSTIIRVVNIVSARLTQAYDKQTIRGFEHLFSFTLQTLQNSSRILDKTGRGYCNGGLYRDSVGAVRFETDRHCADAVHPDMKPYLTLARDADAATMLVTPDMYSHLGITDDQDLPILDPNLTIDKITGQPVVSYSYGPEGNLKVHYSIAMPWTAPVRKLAFGNDVDERDPLLKDQLFMIKPPEEGRILQRDKQGRPTRHGASGSSGSLVTMPTSKGLYMIGTYVGTRAVEDTCAYVCYTLAIFNAPAIHDKLAQTDRVNTINKDRQDLSMQSWE